MIEKVGFLNFPGPEILDFSLTLVYLTRVQRRRNSNGGGVDLDFFWMIWYGISLIYKILNTLKRFWFTVDSSLLLNEEVQLFFYDICHFLFVSLIVNRVGISSPPCYKSFECFLPSPSRQDIVYWIAESINYLKNHPELIENSFRVCGITTNDLGKVKKD